MTSDNMTMELAMREEPSAVMLTTPQLRVIAATDFVPKSLRGNVPAVLACVARGRSMGIPDMVALNGISIIEGKATLSAELMEGIVRSHGHSITGKVTATEAVLKGKRRDNGDTMEATFNLEMAEKAGLLGKANWKKHPDDMMFARAVSKLCRRLFADCFAGGTYVPEEMELTADEVMDEPHEPIPDEADDGLTEAEDKDATAGSHDPSASSSIVTSEADGATSEPASASVSPLDLLIATYGRDAVVAAYKTVLPDRTADRPLTDAEVELLADHLAGAGVGANA